jgi:hypothetical protein
MLMVLFVKRTEGSIPKKIIRQALFIISTFGGREELTVGVKIQHRK